MAAVLRVPPESECRFWAIDKLILTYFAFETALTLGWWSRIPHAAGLLLWQICAVLLILFEVKRPNPTSWIFRNWYPLLYVASCYREMAVFIPAVRHTNADAWLASLDFRIWHTNPTVWLERITSRPLTELLQVAYTLFIPAVLLVAAVLWAKGRYPEFQYYAFLIALGFLVSYVGYLIVPARGPRFLLKQLQHVLLRGLWLFQGMQWVLDRLESAAWDCFPSGHTELTILAWWGSRLAGKPLFRLYFCYTPFLIFATVYLRYHYTVDVLAGAVLAVALIFLTPVLYKNLSNGSSRIGRH